MNTRHPEERDAWKSEQVVLKKDLEERVTALVDILINATDTAARAGAFSAYLRQQARFWKYSPGNVLLIMAQMPDATRVAGFHTWLKLGRHVIKGSKAIRIAAPAPFRYTDPDDTEGGERTGMRFKYTSVFDVSQTEGEPLADAPWGAVDGDYEPAWRKLVDFCTRRGTAVTCARLPQGTLGSSATRPQTDGTIDALITIDTTQLPAWGNRVATLVHEVAHDVLHDTEARKKYGEKITRQMLECQAEATSYAVCSELGIPHPNAPLYLALYKVDREILLANLSAIQQGTAAILRGLGAPAQESVIAA
jgi:antirestriction protein ArdC